MKYSLVFLFGFLILFSACKKDPPVSDDNNGGESNDLYFPPNNSHTWETTSLDSLNWDQDKLEELKILLEENGTRGFLLLKDGKIVVEEYWGKNFNTIGDFDVNSNWYWASAGKTLTAFTVGKAQEEGFLNITDKTSDYLGLNWTSLDQEKEDLITIKHNYP